MRGIQDKLTRRRLHLVGGDALAAAAAPVMLWQKAWTIKLPNEAKVTGRARAIDIAPAAGAGTEAE